MPDEFFTPDDEVEEEPEQFSISDLYSKLEDKWFKLLDGIQKIGIPIYKVIDPIEKMGIPSFPIFLVIGIILILLLITSLFTVFGGTVDFSVKVISSGGQALSGAYVTILQNGYEIEGDTTSASGYTYFELGSGNYELQVSSSQCSEQINQPLNVNPSMASTVTVEIKGCTGVGGNDVEIYFTPENIGIVSAKKYISGSYDGKSVCGESKCVFKTDVGAQYQFESISNYQSKEGKYYSAEDLDDMSRAGTKIPMFLKEDFTSSIGKITVLVKDEDGNFLEGLVVKLVNPADLDGVIAKETTKSGTVAGQAIFEEAVGTTFKVVVGAGENTTFYVSNETYTVVENGQTIDVIVSDGAPTTIIVAEKLQGRDHKVEGIRVRITDKALQDQECKEITDGNGEITCALIRGEEYLVSVLDENFRFAVAKVTGGEVKTIYVEKAPAIDKSTLFITPIFNGLPDSLVIDATVTVYYSSPVGDVIFDVKKMSPNIGILEFNYLDQGEYKIKVSREDERAKEATDAITISEPRSIEIKEVLVEPIRYNLKIIVKSIEEKMLNNANVIALYDGPEGPVEITSGKTHSGLTVLRINEQTIFRLKAEYSEFGGKNYIGYKEMEPLHNDTEVNMVLGDVDNTLEFDGEETMKISVGKKQILDFNFGNGRIDNREWKDITIEIKSPKGIQFGEFIGVEGENIKKETPITEQVFKISGKAIEADGRTFISIPATISYGADENLKIQYRAIWETEDGVVRTDPKHAAYKEITVIPETKNAYCKMHNEMVVCLNFESGGWELNPYEATVDKDSELEFYITVRNEGGKDFKGAIKIEENNKNSIFSLGPVTATKINGMNLNSYIDTSTNPNTVTLDFGASPTTLANGETAQIHIKGVATRATLQALILTYIDSSSTGNSFMFEIAGTNLGKLLLTDAQGNEINNIFDLTTVLGIKPHDVQTNGPAEEIESAILLGGGFVYDGKFNDDPLDLRTSPRGFIKYDSGAKKFTLNLDKDNHFVENKEIDLDVSAPPINPTDLELIKEILPCIWIDPENNLDLEIEYGGRSYITIKTEEGQWPVAVEDNKIIIYRHKDCTAVWNQNVELKGFEFGKINLDDQQKDIENQEEWMEQSLETGKIGLNYIGEMIGTPILAGNLSVTINAGTIEKDYKIPIDLRVKKPGCLEVPETGSMQPLRIAAAKTCKLEIKTGSDVAWLEVGQNCTEKNPAILHIKNPTGTNKPCAKYEILGNDAVVRDQDGTAREDVIVRITGGGSHSQQYIYIENTGETEFTYAGNLIFTLSSVATYERSEERLKKEMTIPVDIETTGVSPLEQRLKGETAMIKFVQKYDEPLDCRNNWCNFDQAVLKFADESNQLNEEKTLNYNVIVPKNLNQMDMLSLVMKEYNEGKGKDFTDYTGVFGTNEYYFDKDASTVKTGNIQFDLKKDGENFILTLTNLGVVEELEVDDWSILYPFSPNTDELTTNVEGSYYGVQKELEKLFTETWGVEIGAAEFRKTSSKQKIYVEICQEGTSCEPLNWDPEREYPAMAYYHYHGGEKMLFFVGYEEGVKNLIGNFTKSIKDEKVTGLYKMLNADGKPYVITSPDLYYYAYLDLESGYPVDLDTDFGVGKVMHSLFLDVHGKDTAINSLPSNEQYTKALRGEHAELEQFLNRGGYTEYPNLVILKTTNTLQDLEKLEATGYGNSYFNFIFGDLSGKIGDSGSNELPDGIYFYKPGDGRDIGTYYVIGSTEPIIKGLLLLIAGDASLSPDSRLDGMYYYDGLGRYFYKLERKGYLIEDDYRVGIRDEMQGEITSLVTDGRSKARVYYIMWGSTGNDDCYLDSNNWFIVKDGVTPTDVTINGEEPIPGNVYEIYAEKNGEKYSININRIQYVSATGEVQTTGTGFYCCGEKHKDLKHFSDRKECEKDNWKFFTWEEDFDAWEIISDKVYYRQDLTEEEQNTCLLFDCNTYCKTIRLFEEGGVVSPSDPTKCICKGPGQLIETLDGPEIAGAGAVPDQELLPCGFIGEDQPCIKGQGNKWCPTLANAKYMCDTEESEGLFGKCKLDYSCKTNNDCVNWEDRKQCDTLTKECVMCTTNTHCTSRTDMGEWAFCNDDKICEDPGSTFTGAIVYHPRAVKDQCNGMEQDEYSFTGNQFVKLLPTGKEFLTETWSSPTKSAVGLQCGENWRTMEDDSGRDCDDNYDKDANELTTGCREAVLSDTDCRGGSLYIEGDDKYEDSPYYSEPAHCDYDELGKYIDFIGHCESDDGYEDPGDWDEYDWCKTHQRGDQRFCIRCPKDKPYICMSNQLITTLVDDDQDGIFDKMYNNVGTIGGKTGPSIICNENKDCASIGTYTEYLSSNQINGGDGGGIRRGVYKHAGGKITINSGEQPLKG